MTRTIPRTSQLPNLESQRLWLEAAAKRSHRIADAPDIVLDAVMQARMDPKHAQLDELLK